jgi:hypothetical protein
MKCALTWVRGRRLKYEIRGCYVEFQRVFTPIRLKLIFF